MEAMIALRIKVMNSGSDEQGCNSSEINLVPTKSVTQEHESMLEVDFSSHTASKPSEITNEQEIANLEILDRVKLSNTTNTLISTIKGVFIENKEKDLSYNK